MFPSDYFNSDYFSRDYFVEGLAPTGQIYPFLYPPSVPTATPGTSTEQAASCAFVMSAIAGLGGGTVASVFGRTGIVTAQSGDYSVAQVTGAAPLSSPAFINIPTAPTASIGTNTTQIATTAFVLANAGTGAVASVFGRTGVVAAQAGDYAASQVTNAVDSTGSYANPTWITSLAGSKITGVVDGPEYNVLAHGLVGNGTTDNTAALQALVNAIAPLGGGTMLFPAGNYRLDSAVDLTGTQSIVFRGLGTHRNANGSTISYASGTGSAFYGGPAYGVRFEGLHIRATNVSYNGNLISFDAGVSLASDPTADDIFDCAFEVPATAASIVRYDHANTVNVSRCSFMGGVVGLKLGDGHFCIAATVCDQCLFMGQVSHAITMTSAESILIHGCAFEARTDGGPSNIFIDPGTVNYGISVIGCWFGDDGLAGGGAWIDLGSVQGVNISGNRILATDRGIRLVSCSGVAISGNEIYGGAACIDLVSPGSVQVQVRGNKLDGGAPYAGVTTNDLFGNSLQDIDVHQVLIKQAAGQTADIFRVKDSSNVSLFTVYNGGYLEFNAPGNTSFSSAGGTYFSDTDVYFRGGNAGLGQRGDFRTHVGGAYSEFYISNQGTNDNLLFFQGGSDAINPTNGCIALGGYNTGGSRVLVQGLRAADSVLKLSGVSGQAGPLLEAPGRVHFDARYSSWHALPDPVAGTITLNWAVGDRWYGTLASGVTALAFSNVPPAGSSQVLLLRITQPASGAAGTLTWPAGTISAPALSTTNGATDLVSVSNESSGTTYDVMLVSQATVGGVIPVDNAPATLYVATTGSDTTGNGTSGSPYATLAKALSVLPDLLLIDHSIIVANGTYAAGIDLRRFLARGDHTLTIAGNVATPANVVFTGTVTAPGGITCGAYVATPAAVLIQGITLDVTANHGVLVDLGARLVVDRCTITAPTSNAISDTAINVVNRSSVEFRGNCTLSNWSLVGIGAYTSSLLTYTSAGTLTITRPDSFGIGIHLAYHASMICQTSGTNISISGAKIGWQLGLHAEFQHIGSSSTLSASNGSTPSPSSGVQATDLSTWSTNNVVNLTHFETGFEANSISYIEAVGTRNLSNVTSPSAATQNSVVFLP